VLLLYVIYCINYISEFGLTLVFISVSFDQKDFFRPIIKIFNDGFEAHEVEFFAKVEERLVKLRYLLLFFKLLPLLQPFFKILILIHEEVLIFYAWVLQLG
jgi:hypothetical protein